ncbi:MAG TPA: hypothetical protein VGX69_05875 [Solirubrobacteraceae bacterium]|jgi:hypothetical protein|nr:hypothetical protein [Solirubrobacteraceae bacterium]
MRSIRRHISYANVVATLALVLAMSGGALAAARYLINSTKQINPKVLRAVRGNTGPRGRTGASGVQGLQGLSGPQGSQGPPGAAGARGPSGLEGARGPEGSRGPEGGSVGEWTPLALSDKVRLVPGYEAAAVRTESAGATARLRGVLEITSEVKADEPVFTIPAGFRPQNRLEFGIGVADAAGHNHIGALVMSSGGVVTDDETPAPVGVYYLLDAITWNLN